ncbi:MAG: tetratricopeptide repeat protein [Candidatus Sungiibacteriota bacterium]
MKALHIKTGIIFLMVITAAAGFYFLDFRDRESAPEIATPTQESGLRPEGVGEDTPSSVKTLPPSVGGGTAKSLPPYQGEPITKLNADPELVASIGTAYLEKYQKNLAAIAERLEKDSTNYDDWLGVAYIKKLFNNYAGTRDAWEYAKVVNPDNPIAYFNLGELYGYEFKEPAKAEENYKSALQLNPYHLDYYIGLANFYEDVPKDLKKAEETLLSALAKIPHTEPNLFAQIGAFYRDQKDYSKALEFFGKALDAATDPGVKKAIQNEIDYIRSKSTQM